MFPHILNLLQWNKKIVAAILTYNFVIYWNNKEMAAAIWVCKIEGKYKIRGQTKQKFIYYTSWKTIKCWDESRTRQSKEL